MLNTLSTGLSIIVLILPTVIAIRLIRAKNSSFKSWLGGFLISSVACYFLLLVAAKFTDMHFKYRLNKFDLDGDGMFSGVEITPQMERAMSDLTNDTGRSLAPITGIIIAPIYSGFWFCLIGVPYLIFRRSNETKKENKAEMATPRNPSD